MRTSMRVRMLLVALAGLSRLTACSDDKDCLATDPLCTEAPKSSEFVISNPAGAGAVSTYISTHWGGGTAVSPTQLEIVYASLVQGTVPAGAYAEIKRAGSEAVVFAPVVDGGVHPIPIEASVGELIGIKVRDANNALLFERATVVPALRPPIVVRTHPARRKPDVPLNSSVVVVFSEPVDGATISASSIRLLLGTTPVAGTARFVHPSLDASEVTVEFVPDAPLAAGTDYRLIVTTQVRDVSGDAVPAPDTVAFTTGTSTTGPPASIQILSTYPDTTLRMRVGTTHQLTATVYDADENVLTDQPVTWATSNQDVVTVSETGLVTARSLGFATVSAVVGPVTKMITVIVEAAASASVEIAPGDVTMTARAGDATATVPITVDEAVPGAVVRVIMASNTPPPVRTTTVFDTTTPEWRTPCTDPPRRSGCSCCSRFPAAATT